jgi:hypothetical protein
MSSLSIESYREADVAEDDDDNESSSPSSLDLFGGSPIDC